MAQYFDRTVMGSGPAGAFESVDQVSEGLGLREQGAGKGTHRLGAVGVQHCWTIRGGRILRYRDVCDGHAAERAISGTAKRRGTLRLLGVCIEAVARARLLKYLRTAAALQALARTNFEIDHNARV